MQEHALQDVMNKVSVRLEAMQPADRACLKDDIQDVLSELEAFACFDPLLADLQKQYLECKYARQKQEDQFGTDSPMVEVALEVEDSAWCAMQACYLELRRDRCLMGKVQDLILEQKQHIKDQEQRAESEKAKEKAELFIFLNTLSNTVREQRRDRNTSIFEWLLLFMIWKIGPFAQSFSLARTYQPAAAFQTA